MEEGYHKKDSVLTRKEIRQSLAVAESLARACMLTPHSAKMRLAARSWELQQLGHVDDNGDYVPPKEILLYLVRYVLSFILVDGISHS